MEQLLRQYQLVQEARGVVLRFLEREVGEAVFRPVPAFSDKTVAWMSAHIVNTYLFWVANFSFKQNRAFYEAGAVRSVGDIAALFGDIDVLMHEFIRTFGDDPAHPLTGNSSGQQPVSTNAFTVFTHVLTHEFHHKGQILSMCRLLGHVPPDADVIRT